MMGLKERHDLGKDVLTIIILKRNTKYSAF
jgi:hypothetical protein